MFHRTPEAVTAEPTHVDPAELIPLSVLQLDLPAPGEGWDAYLTSRGVSITIDDVGRPAIARTDARMLIAEQREREVRQAEHRARQEAAAIEADQRFRARLGHGIPSDVVPHGMTYAEAAALAELDRVPYSPRASLVADVLDNSADTMVFHPYPQLDDES
jgi:hypothetical protein